MFSTYIRSFHSPIKLNLFSISILPILHFTSADSVFFSVSKTMKELELKWKKDKPIKMYKDLRMPQFEITNINDTICQESFHIGKIVFYSY